MDRREIFRKKTHNGDTVVVNVCLLVELLLDLGVLTLGSEHLVSRVMVEEQAIGKNCKARVDSELTEHRQGEGRSC